MSESIQSNDKHLKFLELLPLTIALAGLPTSETGKYFTQDQIEARTFTIKHAYRQALAVTKEIIES